MCALKSAAPAPRGLSILDKLVCPAKVSQSTQSGSSSANQTSGAVLTFTSPSCKVRGFLCGCLLALLIPLPRAPQAPASWLAPGEPGCQGKLKQHCELACWPHPTLRADLPLPGRKRQHRRRPLGSLLLQLLQQQAHSECAAQCYPFWLSTLTLV